MAQMKFHRVNALPGTPEADAFYMVLNGNYAETYVTSSTGVAKMIGNTDMIQAIVNSTIAGTNVFEIVADIAARDALVLDQNTLVLVTDASADPTVDSGAALYAWNNTAQTYTKVAEYESLDLVLSWANITGKPTATPAAIDQAVIDSHTHSNKTQLDKISEDVDQNLMYNSQYVVKFTTVDW